MAANPVGIYFPGLSKEEVNEVRRRFATVAEELGYLATRSKEVRGSPGALITAIARGEVVVVRPPTEAEAEAIADE